MSKIRVLPDVLASQVAAGEVVERPASVVKELVENSIDAGARDILVEIDRGGSALIRVTDDGCGMNKQDALLSLERHATSKLRASSDLSSILTLGFRGEAVPSIASVSRFRMVTREAESVSGTEIVVEGGRLRDVREAGCAPGTTIEAKTLFYNVPARKKFLRTETTESAHIEFQLRLHALAAPQVRFRLRKDGREAIDFPPAPDAGARVRQMLGSETGRELIALPLGSAPGINVEGFLLPARHARKGRRHQCVFLNGRPVEDPVISRALAEGFRGTLVDGLHPAAWLWIEMDPRLVDVNVHPAKREVRFHKPHDLRNTITDLVAKATRPTPSSHAPPTRPAVGLAASPGHEPSLREKPAAIAQPTTHALRGHQPSLRDWIPKSPDAVAPAPTREPEPEPLAAVPRFRILGLLRKRYVLMESDDGLVILDPKAAHERILYEELKEEKGQISQPLLVPVLLDFDPRDRDVLLRHQAEMARAGVEIESFGGNTIHLTSLPSAVHVEDPQRFLSGLLDELLHGSTSGKSFAGDQLAKTIARRSSLLITPRLEEVESLLERLFLCELPYCTADGRPTISEYALTEIDKRFGKPN